ncbi:MAG: LysM peptidoglycan-binding domain-containing protein [Bdellovibrionales bacterium]|nr:LysM peptidoglycan-binding domain-containing protein [Bdellovibrionales bacterium]
MKALLRPIFLTGIFAALAAVAQDEVPAQHAAMDADPALSARLTQFQTYRVKHNESLSKIAKLLYGHSTWWRKLRKENGGKLDAYGPDDVLPRGLTFSYYAPKIEDTYTVNRGDYLVRIATWKYGDTAMWETLYQNNADKIKNPNLIHPGDVLTFLEGGSVQNKTTGQTVIDGARNPAAANGALGTAQDPIQAWNQAFKAPAQPLVYAPPEGTPGVLPRPTAWEEAIEEMRTKGIFESPYFWAGFVAMALLLLWLPISWAIARARRQKFTDENGVVYFRNVGPNGEILDDEEEEEDEWTRGQLHHFKKRPVEEYKIDKSLIHYEDGEVANQPGYHSLVPKKLRKYLKRKGKESRAA